MSEELGIAFAVSVGQRWINQRRDPDVIVRTIDIDEALALGTGAWGPTSHQVSISTQGTRRPDYLIYVDSPASSTRFTLGTIESKGTIASKNNLAQLSSANDQLKGVRLDGAPVPGLAVGTVLNSSGVFARALQLAGGDGTDARTVDEIEIDTESLDRSRNWEQARIASDDGRRSLVQEALATSWANLGYLSGNENAYESWASEASKTQNRRSQLSSRNEEIRQTSSGVEYAGTSVLVPLPGGALRIFTGVERELNEALAAGSAERILQLQHQLRLRTSETELVSLSDDPFAEYSTGTPSADGAVTLLEATFTE